jgi:hypothetical protein
MDTPPIPSTVEAINCQRSFVCFKTNISPSAIQTGMVATTAEAMPDGTVFSAQNKPP